MRLIDADALIERCNGMIANKWNSKVAPVSWANAYADFIDDVDDCPTVELPRWIPVTERLPDVHVPVLVYTKSGDIGIDETFPRMEHAPSWAGYCDKSVTHWMPLPSAPKEDET